MTSIIYKHKDFLIINKPVGVASQSDRNGENDALAEVACQLSHAEKGELHVINRLDQVVGGLMLVARNKAAAAKLSEMLSEGIVKEYRAVVEGEPGVGIMKDYLYKDSILGKAYAVKEPIRGAKEAELEYATLECAESKGKKLSLVRVVLKTGRFHQIRAQFSSRKMPLVGDKKYGSRDFSVHHPALFAVRLAFRWGNEVIDVKATPNLSEYPWSLFDEKNMR